MNNKFLHFIGKYIFLFLFSVIGIFSVFQSTLAIDITKDPCGGESCLQHGIDDERLPDELRNEDGEGLKEKIISVINYLLTFLGIALLIVIIYAGIILIFSNGEDDGIEKAKKMILYAILGVIIIVLSYAIVSFITNVMSDKETEFGNEGGGGSEGGSEGGDGSGGDNGSGGGSQGSGNAELEAKISKLIDDMNVLKEQGADKNIDVINALQDKIDQLEKTINNPSSELEDTLTKAIEELKKQIESLEKEEDPENNKELDQLQKDLNELQDRLNSSVSDSESALEGLLSKLAKINEGGALQSSEIKELRELLESLQNQSSGNPELEKQYKKLENYINKLSEKVGVVVNGNDGVDGIDGIDGKNSESKIVEKIIKDFTKNIDSTKSIVEKMSEVRPRIIMKYARKSVPTTITLSAEKTYIKGLSLARLTNDHYHWAVVDPNGIKQIIGNGITREFTITVPGRYVFFLNVDSPASDVISGEAIQSFSALSQETTVAFRVGEKTSRETLQFTSAQNENGIIFNPSLVKPKAGRTIIRYIWNFDGYKVEELEGKPVIYSFSDTGKHKVSLTVTDNTNQSKKSKIIPIEITRVVSYFSLKKDEYKVGEAVSFSASKSKSDNGFIQEFDWQILNDANEIVKEFQDESFSYSFLSPGNYIIRLTVLDSEGGSSSSSSSISITAENSIARFSIVKSSSNNPAHRLFDASKSSDPAGSDLKYAWDFDGDGVFEKTDQITPLAEYTFIDAKEYEVILRVTNQFEKETFFSQKLKISSILTAEIETGHVVYPIKTEIPFLAKTNNGVAFEWNFGDGNGKETTGDAEILHSFEKSGQYTVILTVNDENGNKTKTKKNIFIGTVESPISALSVFINGKIKIIEQDFCGSGKDGIEIFRSDSLELSGEKSINKDGKSSSLDYLWSFPNGVNESGKLQDWKFLEVSTKGECEKVTLRVEDLRSGKSSAEQKIYFFVKNNKPKISSFTVTPSKKKIAPLSIPLTIKAEDLDGKIVTYSWWAQRKGTSSKEKIGFHTTQNNSTILTLPAFGNEGDKHEYLFYGQVSDSDGEISTTLDELGKSISVGVETGKNKAPKITVIADKKNIPMGETIVFTAQAETIEGEDISHLASFKWDFDGDNIFDHVSTDNTAMHKYMIPGNKIMKVKVSFQGLSSSTTSEVSVSRVSKLPLALFSFQKNEKGEIVFNADNSKYDKSIAGNAMEYIWDFNTAIDSDQDGNPSNDSDSTKVIAKHLYDSELKEVEIQLSIIDATKKTDTITKTIRFEDISGIIQVGTSGVQVVSLSDLFILLQQLLSNSETSVADIESFQADIELAIENEEDDSIKNKLQSLLKKIKNWKNTLENGDENISMVDDLQEEVFDIQKDLTPESAPLLSDKSMEQMANLSKVLNSLENDIKENSGVIKNDKGEVIETVKNKIIELEKIIEKVEQDITKEDVLYDNFQRTKEYLENLKNGSKDKTEEEINISFEELKKSLSEIETKIEKSSNKIWKPISSLGENINKSLLIEFETPTTTLDVYGGEKYVQVDESIEIFIFTKNADGSFYTGDIEMNVIEGLGKFTPRKLKSIEGRGVGSFTPSQSGITIIEVTAKDTVSGSLSETLTFFVQE